MRLAALAPDIPGRQRRPMPEGPEMFYSGFDTSLKWRRAIPRGSLEGATIQTESAMPWTARRYRFIRHNPASDCMRAAGLDDSRFGPFRLYRLGSSFRPSRQADAGDLPVGGNRGFASRTGQYGHFRSTGESRLGVLHCGHQSPRSSHRDPPDTVQFPQIRNSICCPEGLVVPIRDC